MSANCDVEPYCDPDFSLCANMGCQAKLGQLTGYMAASSPLPGEVTLRESINSAILPSLGASSPLANMADRLVADAIRRASLTRRPSSIKYPTNYFSSPTEESSSSSEDETTRRRSKKIKEKV